MKKMMAVVLALVLGACSGEGPTGPDTVVTQPEAPVVSAPAPVAPVTVAPPPAGKSFEGYITPNGGWFVKNTSTNISQFTAYYTSFDNQSLSLGSKTVTRNPGDTWEDTFNRTCIQVDLTYGAPGDAPFLAGFINGYGQVVKDKQARDGCSTPTPEPSPEPTPTPEPTPSPTPTPSPSPTPTPTPTCADLNPNKGAASGNAVKTVTILYKYDFDNLSSSETTNRQTTCTGEGGSWSGDDCTTPVNHGDDWNFSGPDGDLEDILRSVSVTGNYSVAAGAAQTVTFNIVYTNSNPDFVKKSKTVQVACGQALQGSFTWGPGDTHNSSPDYGDNNGHLTGTYIVTSN